MAVRVFLLLLIFPFSVWAKPIVITDETLSLFSRIESTKYVCYEQQTGSYVLGVVRGTELRAGLRWKPVPSSKIDRKVTRFSSRRDRLLSKKQTKKRKRKLKKIERKLAKVQKKQLDFTRNLLVCRGESAEGFAGNKDSLAFYGEVLTDQEVDHILSKVAFGGSDELRQIGLTRGLTALVDALVDGINLSQTANQLRSESLDWSKDAYFYPEDNPGVGRIWTTRALQVGQQYRFMASRNPFHEWMLLLLSGHFATNLNAIDFSFAEFSHYGLPLHWELLQQHAVGNFESLVQAMYNDPAMNHWLGNIDNTLDSPNQNYARELLELFTLGAIDPLTGASNYDEESIVAATGYVSGYFEDVQTDPVTGQEVIDIGYDEEEHDTTARTVFRGIAGAETNASFTPQGFVTHVLYNHPGSSRYIAERFAGQMLYPGLSEAVVRELASTLVQSRYELKPFLKKILSSSAMFSSAARNSCISSPIEFLVSLVRRIVPDGKLPTKGERREMSFYTYEFLLEQAQNSGQGLFEPASVFGWKGACNINRSGDVAKGEGWLTPQRLLNRSEGCVDFFNMLIWNEYDFMSALGLRNGQSGSEIAIHLADKIFDMSLTAGQVTLLNQFLTQIRDEDNNLQTIEPDLTKEYYVNKKIPRVICMLADLQDAQMR